MPEPFPWSPGTGERGCRGRDPPRFHKLLSESRPEDHSGGQTGWGAGEGGQRRRRGERKGTFIVCDLGIPAQEPPGCMHHLSTILQRMDSCTCFKGEETEAQRGAGRAPSSPSWKLAALPGFPKRSVSLQKLSLPPDTVSSGLPSPSLSWAIWGDRRKGPGDGGSCIEGITDTRNHTDSRRPGWKHRGVPGGSSSESSWDGHSFGWLLRSVHCGGLSCSQPSQLGWGRVKSLRAFEL